MTKRKGHRRGEEKHMRTWEGEGDTGYCNAFSGFIENYKGLWKEGRLRTAGGPRGLRSSCYGGRGTGPKCQAGGKTTQDPSSRATRSPRPDGPVPGWSPTLTWLCWSSLARGICTYVKTQPHSVALQVPKAGLPSLYIISWVLFLM